MNLQGKKVLVAGMQSSGISAAYLLKREGAEVLCYDDDLKLNISEFICVHSLPEGYIPELVVVSPSIPLNHKLLAFCKENSVPVRSELELGARYLACKKIMVTGTNGKTTCVTMIEKLLNFAGLRAKAMGNIGYPVSQVVLDGTELDWAVIEVSSFQLEHVSETKADVAVILNLAPDHLDRYVSYTEYQEMKKRICANQTPADYLIFNNEDGAARSFVKNTPAKRIPVSTRSRMSEVYVKDNFYMFDDVGICHVKESKLRGEHNKFNFLVALNVGAIAGVKKEAMGKLIKEYSLLPNRIEYVTTINGKNYYNDSKGTNIHACRFAIESLEGTVGLIMGGSDKKEDFCDFFENLDEKVKSVAITGANAEKIYNSALKMGYPDAKILPTLADCVQVLSEKEGIDNVLLSPCCASFDRYKSYAERGEKFKQLVYAIKA